MTEDQKKELEIVDVLLGDDPAVCMFGEYSFYVPPRIVWVCWKELLKGDNE